MPCRVMRQIPFKCLRSAHCCKNRTIQGDCNAVILCDVGKRGCTAASPLWPPCWALCLLHLLLLLCQLSLEFIKLRAQTFPLLSLCLFFPDRWLISAAHVVFDNTDGKRTILLSLLFIQNVCTCRGKGGKKTKCQAQKDGVEDFGLVGELPLWMSPKALPRGRIEVKREQQCWRENTTKYQHIWRYWFLFLS